MTLICDNCGCMFDSDDSSNCPDCGSVSTRVIKSNDVFEIE